jgi:transcriptional regulator with XRE-family HTH domain
MRRVELAARIGVSESRISEYVAGGRKPTAEGWVALGKLALELGLPDPFYFWAHAGLDADSLQLMAGKIIEGRYRFAGETVPIRRVRETERGREEAGPPVPLPIEFVPNPLTTLCLSVDEKSSATGDSPRGLIILDVSVEGAENLAALWGHVVALNYAPEHGASYSPQRKGLYVGRLSMIGSMYNYRQPDQPVLLGQLLLLSGRIAQEFRIVHLGEYIDSEGMSGLAPEDKAARSRRWKEIQERARSQFRLLKGIRILGNVIGRLTGHLEKSEK